MANEQIKSVYFSAFLERVKLLDLGPIAYQLTKSSAGPHWTHAQTVKAITRYLAFLSLIDRYPHLTLVPTREVDEVWHCHILDTSKYENDCQLLFGRFIHHFPYFGVRDTADQLRWQKAYRLTQTLHRWHFGVPLDGAADCEPLTSTTDCAAMHPRPTVTIDIATVLDNLRS